LQPDTQEYHVRPATPEDATWCVTIAEGLRDSFTPSGVVELQRDLERDDVAIAESNEVVGFVVSRRKSPSIVEIRWLAVAQQIQQQGIGSALMAHATKGARSAGARLLEVKTLDASVPSADYAATRLFYEKRGFELLESIDPFPGWEPGNPCAIYVKVLKPLTSPTAT
jgi:ribosomal protein S18 acetylase RimI-like enzyme